MQGFDLKKLPNPYAMRRARGWSVSTLLTEPYHVRDASAECAAHNLAGPVVIVAAAKSDEPRILPRVPASRTNPFHGVLHCWGF